MKKILFLFGGLGLGGAQKMQAFVANACADSSYSVVVVSLEYTDISVDIRKDIPVSFIGYKPKSYVSKVLSLVRLRKKIKEIDPDAICVFRSDLSRIVVLATMGLNIPIIASERGDPYAFGKRIKKYERAFQKCSFVVFQTEQARVCYNLNPAKTTVIPNPCVLRWDLDQKNLKRSGKIILAAGRFCRQKRFDVLIDAFKIFSDTLKGYTLKIYGSGELKDDLISRIKKIHMEHSIAICEGVPDVFRTEGIPDLFVISSDYEGIPNVLMEAMRLDIPSVSTDCSPGGARLLIGNNDERGLLSPVGDAEALAKNMIIALTDQNVRYRLSHVSDSLLKEFDPEKIKKMWLDVFEKVIG